MDLKQLEYFITIVEEGNITAAAHKLFMTQPPLSNQIKLLEQELDCILFERGSRNIHLTDAGQTLYNYAHSLLNLANVAKQETISVSKKHNETIRIGIVSSLICSTALDWLCSFSNNYSNIQFEIIEGNTYELLQKFETNSIHVAILRTPFNTEKLTCQTIFSDRLVAIGNSNYFQGNDLYTDLDFLANVPLILYRRWENIIKDAFNDKILNPRYFCINDDARTTLYFVENGLGVGLVPASTISKNSSSSIISKEIKEFSIASNVVLAYSCESYMPDCAKAFINFMENNYINKDSNS